MAAARTNSVIVDYNRRLSVIFLVLLAYRGTLELRSVIKRWGCHWRGQSIRIRGQSIRVRGQSIRVRGQSIRVRGQSIRGRGRWKKW